MRAGVSVSHDWGSGPPTVSWTPTPAIPDMRRYRTTKNKVGEDPTLTKVGARACVSKPTGRRAASP